MRHLRCLVPQTIPGAQVVRSDLFILWPPPLASLSPPLAREPSAVEPPPPPPPPSPAAKAAEASARPVITNPRWSIKRKLQRSRQSSRRKARIAPFVRLGRR